MKYVNKTYFNNRAYLSVCQNLQALRNYCEKGDTADGDVVEFKKEKFLDSVNRIWTELGFEEITKTNVALVLNEMCKSNLINPSPQRSKNREMRDLVICHLERNYFNLFITREEIETDKYVGNK